MEQIVAQAGYLFCAVAFSFLTVLAALGRVRATYIWWLVAACVMTVVWSVEVWLSHAVQVPWPVEGSIVVEMIRSILWIGFLVVITGIAKSGAGVGLRSIVAIGALGPVVLIVAAMVAFNAEYVSADMFFFEAGVARMTTAILGLFLLENLYRNADLDQRWSTKYLCFGLGMLFAYDFFFYAESVLFRRLDVELAGARGFVAGVAALLIAFSVARARYWVVDLHISRKMVFHTAALIGAGFYLVLMSLIGYYLSRVGGQAGVIFQIVFLSLAIALMVSIFASGSLRARLRLFIADNFYSARYDYREEWLRFIGTLSAGETEAGLHQRIVSAIAPIMDATAAALWVTKSEKSDFAPEVSWNYGEDLRSIERTDDLAAYIGRRGRIIDLSNMKEAGECPIPDWLKAARETWLIIPLIHKQTVHGILLLGFPRARRELDSEDRNLLETIAQQSASYLAEDKAAGELAEARKMKEFNHRFAFLAHDVKNVLNQLSLVVQNAERHGDNPEFQKDMLETVTNAVSRMRGLMASLRPDEGPRENEGLKTIKIPEFDVVPCLRETASRWQGTGPQIFVELPSSEVKIRAREETVTSILNQVIQNAVDACGEGGEITLRAERRASELYIDVADNGPGMDADFVESTFFRAFETTKEGGYGIGGFQIRQMVRDMSGKLEVMTAPGQGTTIRIRIPIEGSSRDDAETGNRQGLGQ